MSMRVADLLRRTVGAALGLAVLLSGCSGGGPAPAPAITAAAPTPGPLAAASATPIIAPAGQTAAPVASPRPAATATPAPSRTATAPALTATRTPTHVVRFIPTPTPGETASPTPPPAATPAPAPAVRVTPAGPAPTRPAPVAARAWDPRLTQRGAQLIPAAVQPGQGYWRLVQARWFDEDDPPFAGKHYIYLDALDPAGNRQTGVRVQMTSFDLKDDYGFVTTEAKPGEPYAANFAMYIVAPAYRVVPADGAPADAVTGLGLGSIAVPDLPTLTSYGFTWQWTVAR